MLKATFAGVVPAGWLFACAGFDAVERLRNIFGGQVMRLAVGELIGHLNLARHPEGGWYRETYRSAGKVPSGAIPGWSGNDRNLCTAIYFLLEKGDISALHRIRSDEIWHFYAGAPLTVHVITLQGEHLALKLGSDIAAGQTFQAVVPAGCWFGAELSGAGPYSLVGCTVAPGFDFADFEMGERAGLLQAYPAYGELIRRLTRK